MVCPGIRPAETLAALQVDSGADCRSSFRYHIAGAEVLLDRPVPAFSGFRRGELGRVGRSAPPTPEDDPGHTLFDGSAFVLGSNRRLECRFRGGTYHLRIENAGEFRFDPKNQHVVVPDILPASDLAQALCGPLLPLALATRGCFLLHASAIRLDHGVIAITGPSGHGKSTLGAALCSSVGPVTAGQTTRPVADDALALHGRPGRVSISGPYPQPKWPDWGGGASCTNLSLNAVIELVNDGTARPVARLLPETAAALAVVRHGVAARLFSPTLQRRHLEFAALAAASTPVYALHYRRELSSLPGMVEEITRHVA